VQALGLAQVREPVPELAPVQALGLAQVREPVPEPVLVQELAQQPALRHHSQRRQR